MSVSVASDSIKDTFEKDGFVHLPGVFDGALMDRLDALIQNHFGADPSFEHTDQFVTEAQTEVVPWFPQRENVAEFDAVEENPTFQDVTTRLLGRGWETQYCMVMFSKAGSAGQAWHQDCPPEGNFFNLNRLIYTSDIQPEIGGQVVVRPGSHRMGVLPAGDPHAGLPGEVVLTPRKGDLLFLHGHCWHRVLPVRSKYRFSVNYRSANAGAPDDLTDICVYRNMRFKFSTSEIVEQRAG